MANPNPQHNPTDGLGVAAVILLAGSPALSKVGSQVAQNAGHTPGGHQYAVSLAMNATCQLTPQAVDVLGNDYTPDGSFSYVSYNDPASRGPAYKPSNFGSYDASIASVSDSGLITALVVGQAVIEVSLPTFDNTETAPADKVYSQVLVTVTP